MGQVQGAAFRPRVLLVAACAVVLLLVNSVSAGVATPNVLADELSTWRFAMQPTEAASCSLKNHVPVAMAYFSGIETGDRFASFMNPANCTGTPDYPYSIYFVSFPLFQYPGVHWPVGIKLEIWSVLNGDSCAGPGEKLYSRHFFLDSVSFMAPKVGVIKLPDPVCVTGPFYVSILYDGSSPAPYPSVLFDTLIPPVQCVNWGYRKGWQEWNQFWTGPIAGNFMIWVDGFSNSNYCLTDETTTLTVESAHDQHDTLAGSRVSVLGYLTGQPDNKFVSRYTDYLRNEPMPPKSEFMLVGPPPDDSMAGAYAKVTGYVQVDRDPRKIYANDTVTLRIFPSKITKIMPGPVTVASDSPVIRGKANPEITCDSCAYAVLIGGGNNEANNHVRYWEELRQAYDYALTAGGICSSNIFVLYYDGLSRDGAIPQAVLDSCLPGRIHARLDDLSHRVAICTRRSKTTRLELFVAGHGRANGLITLRDSTITGPQLRSWLQKSIDSSLTALHVTMGQSFGGPIADSLKTLNDQKKTSINVSSAGGDDMTWSPTDGSRFIGSKLQSLMSGEAYPVATAEAADAYLAYLDSLRIDFEAWSGQMKAWLITHPPVVGDSVRPKLVQDSLKLRQSITEITAVLADTAARPDLWSRMQLRKFCEWEQMAVPSGGQFRLQFTGDTSVSGSVTVYKDTTFATGPSKAKAAVWHWNVPGAAGFVAGNDKRTLNGNVPAVTSYWIHNDNLEATVTATLRTTHPGAESVSNPYAFAGFSLGGTDKSNYEFGAGLPATVTVPNVELPGLALYDVPGLWGGCGSSQVTAQYSVPALTPWHSKMEFRVEISQVITAGTISFSVTGAQHSSGSFTVSSPGSYRFDCGALTQTGANQVVVNIPVGCFSIDSWALRSAALDPLGCCVGTTGNVNGAGIVDLSDLSLLIAYLISSPRPTLPCPEEANINTAGVIDLSDLSLLVVYLLGQISTLPACP